MYFAINNRTQRKSIFLHGKDATILDAVKKCNEYAAAITKCLGQDWSGHTPEERDAAIADLEEKMADMLICNVNIMEIYGFDKNDINRWITKKQDRLRVKMELMENERN